MQNPLALRKPDRATLPDRVAKVLRRSILAGAARPGQRMESMRTLSRELGVSIGVTREALAQLKAEGLVEIRHGAGTFVSRSPGRARPLKASRLRAGRREAEELRHTVEPALARAAARRAHPPGFHDLHFALVERMLASGRGDPTAFVEADLAFHLAVSRMSHNAMGASAYRMAAGLLRSDMQARARALVADRRLDNLHRVLVEAIGRGRPLRAERAARAIVARETRLP